MSFERLPDYSWAYNDKYDPKPVSTCKDLGNKPPLMPISRMAPEYHHEFMRIMNITSDKTTMFICPIIEQLKTFVFSY